jgi:acetylornithine deacetylase/succinyl-diaminopimelate desuccinylase-like protein
VARIAAISAVGLAFGLATGISPTAGAIWPFDRGDDRPLGQRAAEILSRAIAIRTVDSPDGERALGRYLVDLADDADLDARLVEIPSTPDTRAIVWARLAGTGAARPIVLLSHLDVVPADASEWSTPPFEGRIENGAVIGRGALDAKGITVIQLLTLIELAKRDEPLLRDVILLATPDEEAGGKLGAGYVVAKAPELLDGAEFLLTEGGNIRAPTPDSPSIWGVAVAEKSPCWLELTARGSSGHTATPAPDAVVPRLIAALDSVRRVETPIRVVPEVQRMFQVMAEGARKQERAGYHDLRKALASDRRFRRRFLGNPGRNALVRNTVSITVLEGAPRTNVAPARARARIDARLLPGESCADLAHAIGNVVADESVEVAVVLEAESPTSPIDTDLYRAIERVAERHDPGSLVVPRLTAGSTDARYFRKIGIVAYGFVPRWLSPEETRGIHGADERVEIETLERGTQTLIAIIEELAATGE